MIIALHPDGIGIPGFGGDTRIVYIRPKASHNKARVIVDVEVDVDVEVLEVLVLVEVDVVLVEDVDVVEVLDVEVLVDVDVLVVVSQLIGAVSRHTQSIQLMEASVLQIFPNCAVPYCTP